MAKVSTNATENDAPDSTVPRIAIERHRRGNRWMHWINFPLLTVMIWSGLRIYWADLRDPFVFGIAGWEIYEFFPDDVNETLGLERRLARGMAFHFTFAWLFVINATAFGLYLWRTAGWRNFVPKLDDLRTIPAVLLHEVGLKKDRPPQGKYNGVQQLSYGAILVMGFLTIVSGFAIYKPTQLAPLTALFGGYSGARFVHFATTIGFLLFFVIHIVQVARDGLSGLMSMVTGYELMPPQGPPPRNGYAEQRFNARIRDLVSVLLLPTAAVLLHAAIDTDPNPGWARRILVTAVIFGLIWDVAWTSFRGSTPGKQVLGLRVVRQGTSDGPGVLRSAVRVVPWLPLLLLLMDFNGSATAGIGLAVVLAAVSVVLILTDDRRRSVGDRLAGTEVIAVPTGRAELPTPVREAEEVLS